MDDDDNDDDEYLQLHEEVKVLPFIPHGIVYKPNTRPVVQTLVVLECVNPPPNGPLEDADQEYDDDCKQFTLLFGN